MGREHHGWRSALGGMLAATVVVACTLAWPLATAAQPAAPPAATPTTQAYLDWDPSAATLGCPESQRIAPDIDDILGRPATTGRAQAAVVVSVRFERSETGWLARMALTRPGGEPLGQRLLEGTEPDCMALGGPIALVAALAIEAARPEIRVTVLPAPEAIPEPKTEWRAQSRGDAVATGGLLPGFALGARLSLGVVPPSFWALHASVTLWPEVERSDEGRGGVFSAWHVGLSTCPTLATSETGALLACAGVDAGMMSALGVGLDYTESPNRFLALGHAELAAFLRLGGPFSLGVQAGAAVPFVRPRFVYTGAGGEPVEVHRSWPVVPQGAVSLGFEIPPVW